MDLRLTCPPEPKQGCGHEKHRSERGHEAVFLGAQPVLLDVRDEVEVLVRHVDADADEAGHHNTQKHQAQLADVEAVHAHVDQGEGFEEGVVDGVEEGGVDVREEDGGVLDADFRRDDEGVVDYLGKFGVSLVDLGLRAEGLVAGQFAEALGAAEQDVGCAGLGEGDKHQDEDGARHPEDLPEGPAPVFRGDGKAGEGGADGGRGECRGDPGGQAVGEVDDGEDVLHGGAAGGEAWAAEEAGEETEDEEPRVVVDEGGGHAEDDEDGEGCDVGDVAAETRDLAQR